MSVEIVIPAHNEQHRIDSTLTAYRTTLTDPDVTFTVAMDDCTDGTADIVAAHAGADARVRSCAYPRLGKGGVLAEAFRRSTADHVGFVDADCATPPTEIAVLIETLTDTGAQIAIASRWHPSSVIPGGRSVSRRFASVGFAWAVRAMFDLPFADTQCGAKVLTGAAAHRIAPLLSSRDFVFDVDLLVTARALGLSVAEAPTVWIDREGSRVQVGRDSVRMAASLGRLWLHHRVVPVRMPSSAAVEPVGESVTVTRTETVTLTETVEVTAAVTVPVSGDRIALPGQRSAVRTSVEQLVQVEQVESRETVGAQSTSVANRTRVQSSSGATEFSHAS